MKSGIKSLKLSVTMGADAPKPAFRGDDSRASFQSIVQQPGPPMGGSGYSQPAPAFGGSSYMAHNVRADEEKKEENVDLESKYKQLQQRLEQLNVEKE